MESEPGPLVVTCPRRLRIVAYVFCFYGVSSLLSLLKSFLGMSGTIDLLGLAALPAAYYLVTGSLWRGYMIFVAGGGVLGAILGIAFVIYKAATGQAFVAPYPGYPGTLAIARWALLCCFCLGVGLLLFWVLRVLLSKEGYNYAHRLSPQVVRVERSTWIALVLTGVAAIGVTAASWGVRKAVSRWEARSDMGTGTTTRSDSRGLGQTSCYYGLRFGHLVYVVLQDESGGRSMSQAVRASLPRDEEWVVLTTPDDREINLPNETQLYEIVDGQFRTSPRRVTKEQLEAFLDSRSKRYTIDALLSFVDAVGGKPGNPAGGQESAGPGE